MQVEVDMSDLTVPPICHRSHKTECPDVLMNLSNRGMASMIAGSSIIIDRIQTK